MAGMILNLSAGSHSVTKIECGSSSPNIGGEVNLGQFASLIEFNGGNNGISSVVNSKNLLYLTKFIIQGNNTIGMNASDLPVNLQDLDVRGSNTMTGPISSLPSTLKSIILSGQNTISGNIENFPYGMLSIDVSGNNTIGGSLNLLNTPFCKTITVTGLNTIGGTINSLPPTLEFLFIGPGSNNTTTGNISSLPTTLKNYSNETSGNVTGDIGSLPAPLEVFSMITGAANTTFGNIANLPANLKAYRNGGVNTTTGDIAQLPIGIVSYRNRGNNTVGSYTSGRTWAANMEYFENIPATLLMSAASIVSLLVDLSNASWSTSFANKTVTLNGPTNPTISLSAYPSAQTAIQTLQSKGVTVQVNTTT